MSSEKQQQHFGLDYNNMRETLDRLKGSYKRPKGQTKGSLPKGYKEQDYPQPKEKEPYLLTLLNNLVYRDSEQKRSRTEQSHRCIPITPRSDCRVSIPSHLLTAIRELDPRPSWNPEGRKVTITWIASYLAGHQIDTSKEGWERFECSHRCIQWHLHRRVAEIEEEAISALQTSAKARKERSKKRQKGPAGASSVVEETEEEEEEVEPHKKKQRKHGTVKKVYLPWHGEDKAWLCVEGDCLVWESKSYNQERGNRYCTNQCSHYDVCRKHVCECNGFHVPYCI